MRLRRPNSNASRQRNERVAREKKPKKPQNCSVRLKKMPIAKDRRLKRQPAYSVKLRRKLSASVKRRRKLRD